MKLTRCINSSLFRRIELQVLTNLTARALSVPSPRTWTLSNSEALRYYAQFTANHLRDRVDQHLLQRMGNEAYRTGRWLRRIFFLRNQKDIEQFTIALYRNIGISLECSLPGQLCFRHCYFAHFYSPTVCLAASALDEGIMSGLAGEGRLTFQQRITQGNQQCIATFKR